MTLRLFFVALVLLALHGCSSFKTSEPENPRSAALVTPDKRFAALGALISGEGGLSSSFERQLSTFRSDPTYPCHHPAYAYYFAQKLGQTVAYRDCPPTVPFYLIDSETGGYTVSVAPALVRAIHIMFASPGDAAGSRFGHVSIRLIVCPNSTASDQECSENIFNHVVLGYVAHVNDFEMSIFKGVFGGYDARLTGFSFMETYRTNTLLADRNLFSVPLRLRRDEVEQIVRELSEIHWSFRGDYRFFTNNCATLLQDTLFAVLNQKTTESPSASDLQAGYLRPDAFFDALGRSDLANNRVLDSLEKAERDGYYFPSTRPYYEQAFDLIGRTAGWAEPESLGGYLQLPAKSRLLKTLKSDALLERYTYDQHALEAHLILEERALIGLEKARLRSLMSVLGEPGVLESLEDRVGTLGVGRERALLEQCILQPARRFQGRLPVSAGIPGPDFLKSFPVNVADCNHRESRAVAKHLINDWLPRDHQSLRTIKMLNAEIEHTEQNLAYLRTMR